MNRINTIPFSDLINWSVQYHTEMNFSYNEKFNLVSLKSFLIRNKTRIEVENEKQYKRVTVSAQNRGITLRDVVYGDIIGTKKQFIVSKKQFLLSKIDARNGAFGIVPNEVDGSIITGNFWAYDVDYSVINPTFLSLIVTTPEFIQFCENASNGTTNRHYLQEALFLTQKIPLPSLQEQNRIVRNYNKKIQLVKQQEKEAKQLKSNLSKYIDKVLGIKVFNKESKQKGAFLKIVNYSNFYKWGVKGLSRTTVSYLDGFEQSKISQVCSISSGGTPSRSRKEYYTGAIPWVKTGEVINDIIYETKEHITEEAIKNSSAKLYKKGSLIIAMYGQGKTRGRTAKLGIDATTNQACAVLYDIDNSKVLTDYLWVFLLNEYNRLRKMASGNSQPNLNAQMIKNYPVVIPPMEIQQKIIDTVSYMKQQIKYLENQAFKNKKSAISEFEQEIFKPV